MGICIVLDILLKILWCSGLRWAVILSQFYLQVRKNFFPPRPRRKMRKRRSLCSHKKESSLTSLSTAHVDTSSDMHMDSGLGSSQGSSKCETDSQEASNVSGIGDPDMCVTCLENPRNGIFVHRKIGHICCCYKCALKVWKETGRCPVCNCKVNTVLKAIVVWKWTELQSTFQNDSDFLVTWTSIISQVLFYRLVRFIFHNQIVL